MGKNVRRVEDQFNDTVARGDTVNDDIVSVDSSNDADDSNDVEVVEPNNGDSTTVDDTCNDRPLESLDRIFYVNYGLVKH